MLSGVRLLWVQRVVRNDTIPATEHHRLYWETRQEEVFFNLYWQTKLSALSTLSAEGQPEPNLARQSFTPTTILTSICTLTNLVQMEAIPTKEAVVVPNVLVKIFCITGMPKIIQSDNGREFKNDILQSYALSFGIEWRFLCPWSQAPTRSRRYHLGSWSRSRQATIENERSLCHRKGPFKCLFRCTRPIK